MLFLLRLEIFRKRSEASTDCGSLALSVLMIVEVSPVRGAGGIASPSLWRRGVS